MRLDNFIDLEKTSSFLDVIKEKEFFVKELFNKNLAEKKLTYGDSTYPLCLNPVVLSSDFLENIEVISRNFLELVSDLIKISSENKEKFQAVFNENEVYRMLSEGFFNFDLERLNNLFYRLDGIIDLDGKLKIIEGNMNSPGGAFTLDAMHKLGQGIYFDELNFDVGEYSPLVEKIEKHFVDSYKKNFSNGELFLVAGNKDDSERSEHLLWSEKLIDKGVPALTIDYRDPKLVVMDGSVYYDDKKVGIIYRRVYPLNENSVYLESVNTDVIYLNPMESYILGSKSLFALFHRMKDNLLSKHKEFISEHIPYTAFLSDFNLEDLKNNKDDFVLKAVGLSGGKGIFVGRGETKESWEKALVNASPNYVVQRYYDQPEMKFVDNKIENVNMRKFDFNIYCIGKNIVSPYVRVNAINNYKSNNACGSSESLCYFAN